MKSTEIFPSINALAEAIAFRFREEANKAARENRLYSVVLTGGTTAPKVYYLLGSPGFVDTIPWDTVHLFWTDERCVLPENSESNFGTIHRAFLHSIPIPDANIHRIRGEANPKDEANRYSLEIRKHQALRKNSEFLFDWVLLGLGLDGHIASLFPDQDGLLSTTDLCSVARHPETGQSRITLTASTLRQTANITFHVIGKETSEIVSILNSQSTARKKYPADYVEGEWYLDKAAASGLKSL